MAIRVRSNFYLHPSTTFEENIGEPYEVPQKDEDKTWNSWLKDELVEKQICRIAENGDLVPIFSPDGQGALFGENQETYEHMHRIKNEPGYNYVYRVWLQFLYDQMVRGERSTRVLRLSSFGDEFSQSMNKWRDLSKNLTEVITNDFTKRMHGGRDKENIKGTYIGDVFELLEINDTLSPLTDDNSRYEEDSTLESVSRSVIKNLISKSQFKNLSRFKIFQNMRRSELNEFADNALDGEKFYSASEFKNKKTLIKVLIEENIDPPDYEKLRHEISVCIPVPILFNDICIGVESLLKKILYKINNVSEENDVLFALIPQNIREMADPNNPTLGRLRFDGQENTAIRGKSRDWIISRAAETFSLEIIRILVSDLAWISIEEGEHLDVEIHYDEETADELIQQNHIPNMIYFSRIFMGELTVEPANNEPHPIFRMMKSNTMRWMYCEPEDHSIYSPGGFIHNNSKSSILQEQIVRNLSKHKVKIGTKTKQETWNMDWPERTQLGVDSCEALNSLQKTQWEVNLDLLNRITNGFKITNPEVEIRNPDGSLTDNGKIILKDFISDAFDYDKSEKYNSSKAERKKEIEEATVVKLREINEILQSCFKAIRNGDNVFWHPWKCDWRGRFNSVSKFLSPQGSDLSKAMIRFKQWKILNEEGWKWFKIHVCNYISGLDFSDYFAEDDTFSWDEPDGYKNRSFSEREKWTDRHSKEIMYISKNFEDETVKQILGISLEDLLSPKPEVFQRLSIIIEFNRLCEEYDRVKDWSKIKSGMPIHLDATCNGYQHVSAILRNRNLAEKVNLLAPEEGQLERCDLYSDIAFHAKNEFSEGRSRTRGFLDKNSETLNLTPDKILEFENIFNRNLMKTPTLAVGYGAKSPKNRMKQLISKNGKLTTTKSGFLINNDWNYKYAFENSKAKPKYNKLTMKVQKPITYNKDVKIKVTLTEWFKQNLPDADLELYSTKTKMINKLLEEKILPPHNLVCKENKCGKFFPTEKEFKKHVRTHRVEIIHEDSTLFRSLPAFCKDHISERNWPADLQIKFAESVAKDVMNSINVVTNFSFDRIGKERLNRLQENLKERQKLVSWNMPDENGIRIYSYKPEKKRANASKNFDKLAKEKILLNAYKLLMDKDSEENVELDGIKSWADIDKSEEEKDIDTISNRIAKKLLTELVTKITSGNVTSLTKRTEIKNSISSLFEMAYTISRNRYEDMYIRKDDYRTGVVANFIQSCDAAHMRNVINSMAKRGMNNIWSVHDSFGTHAADISEMREIIIEEFVKLHSDKGIDDWCSSMDDTWEFNPEQEEWDELDIQDILRSEYMIS